ncbi:PadR family transcriptional regulator [Desulfococcus multivorans]|jgi:poly-beta-hydroxybutyrate-responsive repressor|uniref:Transcriptional regulator, PadR-like family n=1 Tax=Desulfococcus multivorans DSM 2059 TaxID=1121405 RepID=S7U181_DESML|nr:helix-turn-helix transcriptional regulator [Desulfococcus multivorans]AQV00736.1 PadR family transcriptional regulator [Desulfococcus multivorans]EPR43201.1 transcriptional regulator, PadR-like family [Desulfococcus multivorans DSM 2059]SJZ40096.1 transcriptional regulator, PadR family [Desulfococcus multivorans DSM 2059]
MSRKQNTSVHLGSKKTERYIQASILLSLKIKPSYGYELIQKISVFGFIEGQVAPGMIYRHLRELEENGLVFSEWETDGAGPAKRVYQLTSEGVEILSFWIDYMKNQAQKLLRFVEMYEEISTKRI